MTGHYHLMDADTPRKRTLPDLLDAARLAGFGGVNVTFPFKEAVIALLDEVSPEAREIGAVNTVVFDAHGDAPAGHNTDRSGFRARLPGDRSAPTPRAASRCCCWARAVPAAPSPSR